ncbi:MAG: fused MFS/spermidine synthase [Roseiflexaceae bacterium]|nr:fused MFS/spermidine synthase [Roseiflexaceae bacterium]
MSVPRSSTSSYDVSTTTSLNLSQIQIIALVLFFISGASALIYEVAWVRLLSLAFGVSVYAVSAVLSAFMGGLALGGWLFGRQTNNQRLIGIDDPQADTSNTNIPSGGTSRLLRIYMLLQLGVAVCALASPLLIQAITALYVSLDQTTSLSIATSVTLRFGLAVLVLLIPTTLMGGTLPVMAQLLARNPSDRGRTLGTLYAANTLGAVLGALIAGLLLIRYVGTTGTIIIAAVGDLATVAITWWMSRQTLALDALGKRQRSKTDDTSKQPTDTSYSQRLTRKQKQVASMSMAQPAQTPAALAVLPPLAAYTILIGFAFSGFASLAYQVVWTRTLAIFSLNAVFSFSIMLATFLAGLALGGALIARRADSTTQPLRLFGGLQLAIGVSSIITLFIFSKLPTLIAALTAPTSLAGAVWAELLPAAVTMFIPTVLIGATFPVAARAYAGIGEDVGPRIGQLYAGNTLGAMLGSLVAGFVLIPLLGLQHAALTLAALNLMIGSVAILIMRPIKRRVLIALAGTLVVAGVGTLLLPPGIYLGFREDATPALKFYREGIDATVAVFEVENPPLKISFVNGRNEVPTDSQSMRAFYVLGHLPALLRPDSKNALVVSFGNGIATGALAQHPLKRITAIELVAGQIEAARLYTHENRDVLNDPRLTIVNEDGRNFLLRDRNQYDIITADATHPINTSSWALFTREFYMLTQARLAPNGIFIQWLPFHDLAAQDYRNIVKTFQSVFPNTTLFYTGGIHTFLVATVQPLTRSQIAGLEKQLSGTVAGTDLGTAAKLADDMLLDAQGVAAYTQTAHVVTDDHAFFLPSKDEEQILQSFAPYALR